MFYLTKAHQGAKLHGYTRTFQRSWHSAIYRRLLQILSPGTFAWRIRNCTGMVWMFIYMKHETKASKHTKNLGPLFCQQSSITVKLCGQVRYYDYSDWSSYWMTLFSERQLDEEAYIRSIASSRWCQRCW